MKKIRRAIHIDFHTMPGIEDFQASFNAAKVAQTLKAAFVDYVNIFARCNIGFSYYPTKIGIPYPGMKGNLLGDTIKECHKLGIGVTAYINAGLNHQLLIQRPEFSRVDKEGKIMGDERVRNNFFRSPCINSGYRQYLYEEIKEMIALQPDGIFCDCFSPKICYCSACIRKMKEKGIDFTDDKMVSEFAWSSQMEVYREIREIVPKAMRLFFNATCIYDHHPEYISHMELECLPAGSWGYDYFTARAPYYRKLAAERIYMTGRFQTAWGDFAGVKSVASMENDVYDALMYGYVPSVGDHMHPRDGLNEKLYAQIGKIYQYVEKLEKWTSDTEPVVEVAIIRNKTQYGSWTPSDSDKGSTRMLAELKVCFDVVNEDMDFSGYQVLIIPEKINLTEKLCKKLKEFDGYVLSCGDSMNHSDMWDFVSEFEEDHNTDGFYELGGETYAMYSCGIKMKSQYSIADYIEPYFNQAFDGLHGYFYIPPKKCEGYSAVALKEKRAHICFNIFEAYQKTGAAFHKALIQSLLDRFLPDRFILSDELPSTSRATLMRGENDLLHVKVTYPELRGSRGIIEEHNVMPGGKKVSIKGEYQKVFLLPDKKEIESKIVAGRTEITLPEICGYSVFLLNR